MRLFSMVNMFMGTPAVASCRHAHKNVQGYLDGTLDDRNSKRVALHLETCRRCGLEADSYLAIKRSLASRVDVDVDAVQRIRAFGERFSIENDHLP